MNLQHDIPPSWDWKRIDTAPGRASWFLLQYGSSQEVVGTQTAKTMQRPAAFTHQRLGGERRGLVAAIGFAEQTAADALAKQIIRCGQQPLFGSDAT